MPLYADRLASLSMEPILANELQNVPKLALTAAGSTIDDALALTGYVNSVTTAAASTGVKLWYPGVGGRPIVVQNKGANDMKVYPPDASGTINGGSAGAAITLATVGSGMAIFWQVSETGFVAIEASSAA